jgi:hypothetical protein
VVGVRVIGLRGRGMYTFVSLFLCVSENPAHTPLYLCVSKKFLCFQKIPKTTKHATKYANYFEMTKFCLFFQYIFLSFIQKAKSVPFLCFKKNIKFGSIHF